MKVCVVERRNNLINNAINEPQSIFIKKTYYAQSSCRNIAPPNCNLDSDSSSVQRSTSGVTSISTTGPIQFYTLYQHKHLVVPLLLAVFVETLVEVLSSNVSKMLADCEEIRKGGRHTSGRVTLGTMTVFIALGAFRRGWLVSP